MYIGKLIETIINNPPKRIYIGIKGYRDIIGHKDYQQNINWIEDVIKFMDIPIYQVRLQHHLFLSYQEE